MSLEPRPTIFANNPLDRAGHLRTSPEWIAEQLKAPETLIMLIWRGEPFILPEAKAGAGRDIAWLPQAALADLLSPHTPHELIFLGLNRNQAPRFCLDISTLDQPDTHAGINALMQAGGAFENLRALAMVADLPAGELAILAQAKGLAEWHNTHPHCARCGAPTDMREAGYKRQCPDCSAEHFPRTDPVVIMVPIFDNKCLLGRQAGWPDNLFSALAGFMEPGETIEEAVARETMEEAGLTVNAVHYHATQPWPFPASLMIGCHARVTNADFLVDEKELAEARWFTKAELQDAIDQQSTGEQGQFMVPPAMAIAHQLIKAFIEDKVSV